MPLAPRPRDPATSLTDGLDPALHISYQVTIVANLMAFAESPKNAARFGVKTREWRVLGTLVRMGPLTAADIVRLMRQDKGSISRAVSALESRGLLQKLPNPRHAGSPFLWLTREGKKLVDGIWPVFREQAELMSAGLTKTEQKTLCRLLDKLHDHAEAVRQLVD
ncbi:MAG: MarR family winged helix-turn-helix transcriptional regulator [Chromatocurvus sp.]